MDLKLRYLSDSTDLMYSELTGGIYREDQEGHLDKLRSTDRKKSNVSFSSIYDVDLPAEQCRQWDREYNINYNENGEPDYVEL